MNAAPWLAGVAGLALISLGGCASTVTRVDCGDLDVVMTESQREDVEAKTGANHFADGVCSVARTIDPSQYANATKVDLTMPSGSTYKMTLEASKQ